MTRAKKVAKTKGTVWVAPKVITDVDGTKHRIANGTVVYNGPSMLDGSPIIAVITFNSSNPKTGNMSQLWILANNGDKPSVARTNGGDIGICGHCPVKAFCYVNTAFAPNAVYRTFQAGKYPVGMPQKRRAKALRLGAYGDPAALPVELVLALLAYFEGHTGYTHQWAEYNLDLRWQSIVMASTESLETRAQAITAGWRTARVGADATCLPGEFLCPATDEGGKKTTCKDCQLCNGTGPMKTSKGVVFPVHGSKKSHATDLIQIGVAA